MAYKVESKWRVNRRNQIPALTPIMRPRVVSSGRTIREADTHRGIVMAHRFGHAIFAALACIALVSCGSDDSNKSDETTSTRPVITTTVGATTSMPTIEAAPLTTVPQTTTAPANRPRGYISEATWTASEWPFSVTEGIVQCASNRVTFAANRVMYAVNGAAGAAGLDDIAPIWKESSTPGLKIDLGPVIEYGLSLC